MQLQPSGASRDAVLQRLLARPAEGGGTDDGSSLEALRANIDSFFITAESAPPPQPIQEGFDGEEMDCAGGEECDGSEQLEMNLVLGVLEHREETEHPPNHLSGVPQRRRTDGILLPTERNTEVMDDEEFKEAQNFGRLMAAVLGVSEDGSSTSSASSSTSSDAGDAAPHGSKRRRMVEEL
jgi:hypothetical protein